MPPKRCANPSDDRSPTPSNGSRTESQIIDGRRKKKRRCRNRALHESDARSSTDDDVADRQSARPTTRDSGDGGENEPAMTWEELLEAQRAFEEEWEVDSDGNMRQRSPFFYNDPSLYDDMSDDEALEQQRILEEFDRAERERDDELMHLLAAWYLEERPPTSPEANVDGASTANFDK